MAHAPTVFLVLQHALLDESHRLEDTLVILLGSKEFQRRLTRYLNVYAHAVGPSSCLGQEFARSPGNTLQVDITVEVMHRPQVTHDSHKPLHRVVGRAHHATRQEESLDVIATIELHGYFLQFGYRERCPTNVVRPTIDTIGAVVLAIVGKHHLQ